MPGHALCGAHSSSYVFFAQAWVNEASFTRDESRQSHTIGSTRIIIERLFKRAQEWKILHSVIKVSEMDTYSTTFLVCCYMVNYDPPLIRDPEQALMCVGEMQWGT